MNNSKTISCVHCGKIYKKKINLDRHIIYCEILVKSKNVLSTEDENENENEEIPKMPTQREMFQILLELVKRNNKLEKQVEDMQKIVCKTKNKNILEWLNTQTKPVIQFSELSHQIMVQEEDIELVFENTFYDMLDSIFARHIYHANYYNRPLFAYSEKINILYVYENNEWIIITKELFVKFLNKIFLKITSVFGEIKKKREIEIKKNEHLSNKYNKIFLKIVSVDLMQESNLSKIRQLIFQNIKKDI